MMALVVAVTSAPGVLLGVLGGGRLADWKCKSPTAQCFLPTIFPDVQDLFETAAQESG